MCVCVCVYVCVLGGEGVKHSYDVIYRMDESHCYLCLESGSMFELREVSLLLTVLQSLDNCPPHGHKLFPPMVVHWAAQSQRSIAANLQSNSAQLMCREL